MTKDYIEDYETLGQNTITCPIIDCAYFTFDRDRFLSNDPYLFGELVDSIQHDKVSVEDQVENYKFKIEKQTIEWWSQQGSEARSKIKPLPDDISLLDHINNKASYIRKTGPITNWWSRSNTFDPVITWRLFKTLDREYEYQSLLPFWLVRDTRTYIDAKTNFAKGMNSFTPMKDEEKWKRVFQQHNCIHDVAADILRMQILIRLENDLEIPE